MSYPPADRCVELLDQILFNYMGPIKYQAYQRERQEKKNQQELQKQQKKQRVALIINTNELRQNIFEKHQWPIKYPFAQQLIDADFCYMPNEKRKDITHCHICDIYIDDWDYINEAYEAHLRLSPNCA